jgi:hypothetical protein
VRFNARAAHFALPSKRGSLQMTSLFDLILE